MDRLCSNGFENDNSEFGFNNGPPFNEPKYCNVTALGIRGQGASAITNQVGTVPRVSPSREVTSTSSWPSSASRNSADNCCNRATLPID